MTEYRPYLTIDMKVDTINKSPATTLEDSRVAKWLTEELEELRRKMSEAYPTMDLQFKLSLTRS